MTKLDVIKAGTGFAIGAGVSRIIAGIVANNVPQETQYQKVVVFAGRVGVAMVVSEVVSDHVDSKIDAIAAKIVEIKSAFSK